MARGMGFSPRLIEYANIREQCAFVHEAHPHAQPQKAAALIKIGSREGKADSADSTRKQKVEKKGVVVGGGSPV